MAIPPILAAKAPPASSYRQQSAAGRYRPHGSFSPAGIPQTSGVVVQAPSAPPILRAQAPAASSYRQQSAAGAYQPHGSFSGAGVPSQQQLAAQRQASVQQQNQKILASYLHGSSQPFSFLTKLPGFASKSVDSHVWDVNPLAKGWQLGRTDMGLDANAAPGTPILAPNDSKVLGYSPNWYNGQPYELLQLTKGPHKGVDYYVAEQITGPNSKTLANADSLPPVGTTFKQGQPIARYATSGTGIEIGLGSPQPGTTLAAATTGYSEGQQTQAGQQFKQIFVQGGKDPGQLPHSQGQPLRIPQGTKPLLSLLPANVRKATVAQVQQPGQPQAQRPPGQGNSVAVVTGAPLSDSQKVFAGELVKKTGLDPGVIAAWVHSEQPPTGLAPNGPHNWLNIGATDSGFFGASNPAWQNPKTAADFTAKWLAGTPAPGFGTAAAGIQAITRTAHQSPGSQLSAIQHSGWAGSGYPALVQVYNSLAGTAKLGTANMSVPSGGSAPVGSSGSGAASSGSGGSVGSSQSGGAPVTGNIAAPGAPNAAGGTTPQDAAAQQQAALLSSFLSGQGTGANPWNVGPRTSGFGSSPSLFSVGALGSPSVTPDLHSVALQSLQALVPGVKLTHPRRKL